MPPKYILIGGLVFFMLIVMVKVRELHDRLEAIESKVARPECRPSAP